MYILLVITLFLRPDGEIAYKFDGLKADTERDCLEAQAALGAIRVPKGHAVLTYCVPGTVLDGLPPPTPSYFPVEPG